VFLCECVCVHTHTHTHTHSLWNRPSAEYLSQNETDRIATDYSDDEFEDGDDEEEDTSLSGFIVDDENKPGERAEGPEIDNTLDQSLSVEAEASGPDSLDLDMGNDD
jgi:hypothetical protein